MANDSGINDLPEYPTWRRATASATDREPHYHLGIVRITPEGKIPNPKSKEVCFDFAEKFAKELGFKPSYDQASGDRHCQQKAKLARLRLKICSVETAGHDLNIKNQCNLKDDPQEKLIANPEWLGGETLEGHTLTKEPYPFMLSDVLDSNGGSGNVPAFFKKENHSNFLNLTPLKNIDMLVVVSYHIWPLQFVINVPFRFSAVEQSDHKLLWNPKPVDDCVSPFYFGERTCHHFRRRCI